MLPCRNYQALGFAEQPGVISDANLRIVVAHAMR